MDGARIGKHCQVFPGAVVSAVPQDLKFAGEQTTAVIGDYTVLRECVTVNRGTVDRGRNRGGQPLPAAGLRARSPRLHHRRPLRDFQLGADCRARDGGRLGHSGRHLGHSPVCHASGRTPFVGGGSLVRKDVPPFVKAAREPLTYAGINSVGLRRRGFSEEQVNELHNLYRLLFLGGMNTQDALARIEAEILPFCGARPGAGLCAGRHPGHHQRPEA